MTSNHTIAAPDRLRPCIDCGRRCAPLKRYCVRCRAKRDRAAAYQRAYYLRNREKALAYQRAYYARNREKVAARRASYRRSREKLARAASARDRETCERAATAEMAGA